MFQDIFHEIAKKYPDTPAIVRQGRVTSYRELDELSDAIAAQLVAGGIHKGAIIPIHRECCEDWLIQSLGIIKAGAAYAPISLSTPPERLAFILNDISTVLTSASAMVIYYTSGSTGEPKGVILSHEAVLDLCRSHCGHYGLSHGIKACVQADVGFDSFLLSTLPYLTVGGTLYLMDAAERLSLVGIHRFLMKNKIDVTFFTTQLAVQYMKAFDNPHLQILFTGGEALRAYTPRSYRLYNLYGPTECTVYVTAHQVTESDGDDIPIGLPIGSNRICIEEGELCVSGPQLSIGYLNCPQETAKKFVPNPHYDPAKDAPCYALMYRTGDLAYLSQTGEYYYRGRTDNQVKISGYRIEPGEVEAVLLKHPCVHAAHVTVKRNAGKDPFMIAYCEAKNTAPDDLHTFLAQKLPEYMLPRKIVILGQLPLNERTGKVDVAALPDHV